MKKLTICALVGILSIAAFGCSNSNQGDVAADSTKNETQNTANELKGDSDSSEAADEEVPEGMMKSHLTGEYVSKEIGTRRPVAVMINNIEAALPSSSVSKASVIYEAPVEGSLTRLMPIWEDYDGLDKIGSVRSCRDYFINYAMGFEAIYVHFGQAVYALPYLEMDSVNNLSGLSGYADRVFYRTSDRKAPHNAYTSTEGILAGVDHLGYSLEYSDDYKSPFCFAKVGDEVQLDDGKDATLVKPGYTTNKAWFEYNEEDGLYYRFEYGEEQMDEAFDEQLAVKNIIFQYSDWENYDENGYLNIYAEDGGACKYFTNGKVIDGTWTRDGEWGPETYYDEDGNVIEMNTGKTWICVIQDSYADRVEIS